MAIGSPSRADEHRILQDRLPVDASGRIRVDAGQPIRIELGLINEVSDAKPARVRLVGLGRTIEAHNGIVPGRDIYGAEVVYRTFEFDYAPRPETSEPLPAGSNTAVIEWLDLDDRRLAVADVTVAVDDISRLRIELDKPRRTGLLGRRYQIHLDHEGDLPVTLPVTTFVPAEEVVVDLACEQVTLQPHSLGRVATKVSGRRLRIFGPTQEHVFDVSVSAPSGSATTTGVFRQRSLFPPVLFKVLVAIVLLLLFLFAAAQLVRRIVGGEPSASWTALPAVDDDDRRARSGHTATWVNYVPVDAATGAKAVVSEATDWLAGERPFEEAVVIWGGTNREGNVHSDGLIYSLSNDEWTAINPTENHPGARLGHTAAWTGDRLVIWGGFAERTEPVATSPTSTAPASTVPTIEPVETTPPRSNRAEPDDPTPTVTTGTTLPPMLFRTPAPRTVPAAPPVEPTASDGAQFDPATSSWQSLPPSGLSPRVGHSMLWTGSSLIVFGGMSPDGDILDDGGILRAPRQSDGSPPDTPGDLSNATWSLFRTPGAAIANRQQDSRVLSTFGDARRAFHAAALVGPYMFISGGIGPDENDPVLRDNYAYDIERDTWHLVPNAYFEGRVCHQVVAGDGSLTILGGLREADLEPDDLRSPDMCTQTRIVDRRDPSAWSLELAPDETTPGAVAFEWTPLPDAPEHLGANFAASWMNKAIGIAFSVRSLDSVAPIRYAPGQDASVEMLPAADDLSYRAAITAAWSANRLVVWGGRGEEPCPGAPVRRLGELGEGCQQADGARIDVDDD